MPRCLGCLTPLARASLPQVRNIRQAVASNSAGSSSYTSCCDAPSSTTTSPRTGSLAINLDTPCGRLPSTADADSAEVLQSWRDTDGLDGEFIDEFNQDEGIAFVYVSACDVVECGAQLAL